MSKITERVSALAKPVVEEEGCSLWDVEYVREAGTWYLRILLDKDGGLSIDDCERISRRLDPILDEADPIPDSYVFEVGSAGAEREIEVRLYKPLNGRKAYIGTLSGYEEGTVVLQTEGELLRFGPSETAQVRLHVSF